MANVPSEFTPWQTIYYYFRKWRLEDVWEELQNMQHAKAMESVDKEESLSLGIIDSRSAKTSHYVDTDRGIDRKRRMSKAIFSILGYLTVYPKINRKTS